MLPPGNTPLRVVKIILGLAYLIGLAIAVAGAYDRACNLPEELNFSCGFSHLPTRGELNYRATRTLAVNEVVTESDLGALNNTPPYWGRLYPSKTDLVGKFLHKAIDLGAPITSEDTGEHPLLDGMDPVTVAALTPVEIARTLRPNSVVTAACTGEETLHCALSTLAISCPATTSTDDEEVAEVGCIGWFSTVSSAGCPPCGLRTIIGLGEIAIQPPPVDPD